MDQKLSALTARGTPDRAVDQLYVINGVNEYRTTVNNMLGISSAPVGVNDTQTLTGKTLTAPAINSPVMGGTITGTYTLGGTVTFPASVVTLTGAQILINKILTSPTINSPTITNASITADAINGFTTANNGTIYGVAVTGGTINGSAISAGTVGSTQLATGVPVQIVSTNFSAVATGTTLIPLDDTIPQITEGDQYMTQVITPKSATNRLSIEMTMSIYASIAEYVTVAVFQDSTANAIAATVQYQLANMNLKITHDMLAGTTSATTFRVRAGLASAGTLTFNGRATARLYGGITLSNMRITEYKG